MNQVNHQEEKQTKRLNKIINNINEQRQMIYITMIHKYLGVPKTWHLLIARYQGKLYNTTQSFLSFSFGKITIYQEKKHTGENEI